MSDERRPDTFETVMAQIVIPLAGLALTYWVGTHAASIEIELRGRIRRYRGMIEAWKEGTAAGTRVAEWYVKAEAPKVIEAAEAITREVNDSE